MDNGTDGLAVVSGADKEQQHCLDFRANASYSDVVRVKRSDIGLLESVYSNVEDQSKKIIEDATKGIALAVAGQSRLANRDFLETASGQVIEMSMQFDPFDPELLTNANEALEKKGYCIYIDPTNDPFVPFWMRNQCTSVKQYVRYNAKGHAEEVFNAASFTAGDGRFGILYKPALSHTLVILKKDDPTSANPWRVWKRQIVEMPNRAPVFMVQVKRGFFTGRKTEINFKGGMLASIKVEKKSELKAVSEALVNVVGIIVQIPAKVLIIGNTEAQNQEALIRANQALLQAYAALEAEQRKRASLQSGLDQNGMPRTSWERVLNECLDYADVSAVDDPRSYCREKVEQ
ncbi:hypothetical protein [Sinorhizobium psoraleae]|uniref:F-actin-capping protein subunit alpha n=1 Tax=Sinorhizobium psoraleae TaxID=520838 RepID=A0ABT4KA20_9HYPH|nr:hypothetical protein [Sinorhizobium psoraleae]MCZ4088719.1 hypothetical protein [Sinorhizobium psoraleae]